MKKIVAILLCIWTIALLAGCGSGSAYDTQFTEEDPSATLDKVEPVPEEVKREMEARMENEVDETENIVPEESNVPDFTEKNEASDLTVMPSEEEYEKINDQGYLTDGCYFRFDDMSIDDHDPQQPILYLTYQITNLGDIPFVPDKMFTATAFQADTELERLEEQCVGYDRLLSTEDAAILLDVYRLNNTSEFIEVDACSTSLKNPTKIIKLYDIYDCITDVTIYDLYYTDEDTGNVEFEPITLRYPDVLNREVSYILSIPSDWFDATDFISGRYGGGAMTVFYSRRERTLGGDGQLFAVAVFEANYNYTWAKNYEVIRTIEAPWGESYNIVVLYPNDDKFVVMDESSYDSLLEEGRQFLNNIRFEGAEVIGE